MEVKTLLLNKLSCNSFFSLSNHFRLEQHFIPHDKGWIDEEEVHSVNFTVNEHPAGQIFISSLHSNRGVIYTRNIKELLKERERESECHPIGARDSSSFKFSLSSLHE